MHHKHISTIAIILSLTSALIADTHIPAGDVFGTWTSAGSPYLIDGEITIPTDSTLTIQPDVNVIFQRHYKFIVNGFLEAVGTESDSILFTAADSIEGWGGIRFINAPESSQLSFCTIQYGNVWESYPNPDSYGGGIYCDSSNPVLNHCNVRWNQAELGGGMYCSLSNPIIDHCTINNNTAGWIGGIFCEDSNPTIINCIVRGNFPIGLYFGHESNASVEFCNITENGSLGIGCYFSSPDIYGCIISNNFEMFGGGIMCDSVSSPNITNCVISGNGGGPESAGIICHDHSNPIISYSEISGNGGYEAGGIYMYVFSSPTIDHSIITGNSGGAGCGAMYISGNCYPVISNCTISGNTSNSFYGCIGISSDYSTPAFYNTIIAGNLGGSGIHFFSIYGASINFCDISDNENGNFTGNVPEGLGVPATVNVNGDSCDMFFNIFLDPMFVDTSTSNYHLQGGSPCIDAGDPASPHDPDSTIADIGAFYFHHMGVPDQRNNQLPSAVQLFQNYPNPFNSMTTVPFAVPNTNHVVLTIYDVLGRHVGILVNDDLSPGFYRVPFDAATLSSGIYFCQMKANNYITTRKIILIK